MTKTMDDPGGGGFTWNEGMITSLRRQSAEAAMTGKIKTLDYEPTDGNEELTFDVVDSDGRERKILPPYAGAVLFDWHQKFGTMP